MVVLPTPRQDEASGPTGGQRPRSPVASTIVGAKIVPSPSPVCSCSEAGVGFRGWGTVLSRGLLCGLRQYTTARRLVTARLGSASGSLPGRAAGGRSLLRLVRKRAPVVRALRLWPLRRWAVGWRTTGARLRRKSRPARSACGEMSPAGHTPRRHTWANQRASERSAVSCRPLYGGLAAGLAKGTRSAAAIHPSTRQYQLEVDST